MTDLISNSVRHNTQDFALLSANFGPAYAEENSYSFSIHISKTPRKFYCSGTQQNTVGFNPHPPPPPNQHIRSVGEGLSICFLTQWSWVQIQCSALLSGLKSSFTSQPMSCKGNWVVR